MPLELKGLSRIPKRDKRGVLIGHYYYLRATGARIHGEPGSDEFLQNYMRAKEQTPQSDPNTVGGLVTEFLGSPEFKRISDRERAAYRKSLDEMRVRFNRLLLHHLSDRRFTRELYKWRDEMARTPRMADRTMSHVRRFLRWGLTRGYIDVNRAADVEALTPKNKSRRERVWTAADRQKLFSVAPIEVQRLCLFAYYTLLRQEDLTRVTWNNLDEDGWLVIRQQKTGGTVELPVFALDPLRQLVVAGPQARLYRCKPGCRR